MMIPAPVFSQNMMMPMGQNTTVPVEQTTHYKRYHGDGIDDVLRLVPTASVFGLNLMGEKRVLESGCKYVIVRTSWLYSATGKNFVKSILNLTSKKSEIKVVFDQVGTPTYAGDLAEAILAIVKDYTEEMGRSGSKEKSYTKSGLYHFSNEGV